MSLDEPLRIGSVTADPGLLLAPMEDVSDLPFRTICKEMGADIVYTEFVNAEGLVRQHHGSSTRTQDKLVFRAGDHFWQRSRAMASWNRRVTAPLAKLWFVATTQRPSACHAPRKTALLYRAAVVMAIKKPVRATSKTG